MSEIRDKVKEQLIAIIYEPFLLYHPQMGLQYASIDKRKASDIADKILAIPELAVVDRRAVMPEPPLELRLMPDFSLYWFEAGRSNLLKEGWVKEVKE